MPLIQRRTYFTENMHNFLFYLCAFALFLCLNFTMISSFIVTVMKKGVIRSRPSSNIFRRQRREQHMAAASKGKTETGCPKCRGSGVLPCGPCAGTGIDKINGSVLERWCCKKCKVGLSITLYSTIVFILNIINQLVSQGFGLIPCVCNSSKGLTPEQR